MRTGDYPARIKTDTLVAPLSHLHHQLRVRSNHESRLVTRSPSIRTAPCSIMRFASELLATSCASRSTRQCHNRWRSTLIHNELDIRRDLVVPKALDEVVQRGLRRRRVMKAGHDLLRKLKFDVSRIHALGHLLTQPRDFAGCDRKLSRSK